MPQLGRIHVLALGMSLLGAATAAQAPVDIPVPAVRESGEAVLTLDAAGTPLLSWVDPVDRGHALRFSRLESDRWSAPRTAARGDDWFVNWADRPAVAALADGSLMAWWLVNAKGREGQYGYGIRFARSQDDGASWREVYSAGADNVADYSGFVSVLRTGSGASAVYLAPPTAATAVVSPGHGSHGGQEHVMTLRLATFGAEGTATSDTVLDGDACSCCSTAAAHTARGPLVAYRDRSAGEVRDISIVRLVDGAWTAPRPVHRDGWVIAACPTNGPALSARDERVAIAWFTAAGDTPRLNVSFSTDSGESFSAPTRVDGGSPVGWPAIALLDGGDAAVLWLEALGAGQGEIRLRRVSRDGTAGAVTTIAAAAPGRSTGIPQMVPTPSGLLVAWRDGGVKTALAREPR
jgi:hypothetical protein